MNTKKTITKIIIILSFGFLLIFGKYKYDNMKFISSHKSPDGKCEIIFRRELLSTIQIFPGDHDILATATLKCNGIPIDRSDRFFDYEIIEPEWDLKQNTVRYKVNRPDSFFL